MTKAELIKMVAEDTSLTKAKTKEVYDSVMASIQEELKVNGRVEVHGLGIFRTKNRPAREKLNPQTKAPVQVPADVAVRFRAHKGLRNLLNAA